MKLGDPKAVGELMRQRRLALGFTQQQFAEATGVSPITIMRLELGRLGYIHERTAKALEVPKKIVKRMVMVASPADSSGHILPNSTLAASPNADVRAMAEDKKQQESVSGDAQEVNPMPRYLKQHRKARRAKLEAQERNVERNGKAHTLSPLKKMFLWLANHA